MSSQHKIIKSEKEIGEHEYRTRIREIDFMRVEDTMCNRPLSAFELEVKEKIACGPSPAEELISREEAEENGKSLRSTLERLIRLANFTSNQAACYELIYGEELSDEEAAFRLRISRGRLRWLKIGIVKALKRAHQKGRVLDAALSGVLPEKQGAIVRLSYGEFRPVSEIAGILGMKKRAVQRILRIAHSRILKKNS